jgi:5-methyltetrahydrofolate--homocysteine methyltransferase
MAHILDVLGERVLLCDGAMGSRVQAADLDVEKDYWGQENCTDILTHSRPDLIRDIHVGYFEAGSDVVITNTFGASPVTLGEFGLADEAYQLNFEAACLAREAAEPFAKDGGERFILGDVGPGTKLPSLGHIGYDELAASLRVQCDGLIAGGVDAILIETCQDPLQIKAAVNAAKDARAEAATDTPIFVQVTVETTGTLLVGADVAAAATVVRALGVDLLGVNCATGPQEMAEHVKWLAENWQNYIAVQPNAGLPELVDGETHYPLGAEELAQWQERFVVEDGVNLVGGCCGTGIDHIKAVNAMLEKLAGKGSRRPKPARRDARWTPSVASLYSQVPLRQENAIFSIGERCNANGSKKFRQLQDAGDWDGCVAIGRDQVADGSHAIDVCTAFVGRDEVADISQIISRMRGSVTVPLVIDSTELEVIEAALKLYGGKAIINSINFEDGEEPAAKRLELARRYGAAVIALTIDEDGMAKDAEGKVAIAKRLFDFARGKFGLPASDLLIDPLTFTICTGNEDDRNLAVETLDGIERISAALPDCQIVLGVSNISFGLKPVSRHVLNSVFLDHAARRGMTAAIVHVSKITPLHTIPENELKVVEDLIFDRREEGYDPLHAYIGLFAERDGKAKKKKERPASVAERLKLRIVDGDRQGLEDDLAEAMETNEPLTIINTFLLDGMKVVGELFGAGKMQLPFVLQSAETMKAAVAYLEPHMERGEGQDKATIVLATVKGDVHDIGKNLVDIILTNNGYKVINLGIKQPVNAIIDAAVKHHADAVGMSGLLVKSTVIMRQNLEEMTRRQVRLPVLLGGAALTRRYVEEDCGEAYGAGAVAYAKDAFDGLTLMDAVSSGGFNDLVTAEREKRANKPKGRKRALPSEQMAAELRPVDLEEIKTRKSELHRNVDIPVPPFWGGRALERVDLKALTPFLNETMLYQFHWGFKKAGRTRAEWKKWAEREVRPILHGLLERCRDEEIIQPAAAYGYWKCASEGDTVILFGEDGMSEVARFSFPRQNRQGGLCLADFFLDVDGGAAARDVIALQVVTAGQRASEVTSQWFAENKYQDYLYLHGLSVEIAEALAEYVHKRIRGELGFGHEDEREIEKMLKQGYRGSRYSFGYPACPNMEDQRLLLSLLGAERVGVVMADEDQLHPEQSTSAIVVHHPQAKYFTI